MIVCSLFTALYGLTAHRSPTAMLTVVLHFFGPTLTNFPFGLERNDPAPILRNLVPIGTMIGAAISAGGQTLRGN
jgi:hypothetical protein